MIVDKVLARLREIFESKKVIITRGGIPSINDIIGDLLQHVGIADYIKISGAGIANMVGKGRDIDKTFFVESETTSNIAHTISHYFDALMKPNLDLETYLDQFDPNKEAVIVDTLFPLSHWTGREVYGQRSRDSFALEDKHKDFKLFESLGIEICNQKIFKTKNIDLKAIFKQFDEGSGCVFVGNEDGEVKGGAGVIRAVRSIDKLDKIEKEFLPYYHSVKVMPFLKGIPCSIHGLIGKDEIAVLPASETITLYDEEDCKFIFCMSKENLPLNRKQKKSIEAVYHIVGKFLQEDLNFRGFSHIDGVMVGDQFYPTDLNTRIGSGLMAYTKNYKEFPGLVLLIDLLFHSHREHDLSAQEICSFYEKSSAESVSCNGNLFTSIVHKRDEFECQLAEGETCNFKFKNYNQGSNYFYTLSEKLATEPYRGPVMAKILNALPEDLRVGKGKLESYDI